MGSITLTMPLRCKRIHENIHLWSLLWKSREFYASLWNYTITFTLYKAHHWFNLKMYKDLQVNLYPHIHSRCCILFFLWKIVWSLYHTLSFFSTSWAEEDEKEKSNFHRSRNKFFKNVSFGLYSTATTFN